MTKLILWFNVGAFGFNCFLAGISLSTEHWNRLAVNVFSACLSVVGIAITASIFTDDIKHYKTRYYR